MLHRGPAPDADPGGMWTDARLVDNHPGVTTGAGRAARPVIGTGPGAGSEGVAAAAFNRGIRTPDSWHRCPASPALIAETGTAPLR